MNREHNFAKHRRSTAFRTMRGSVSRLARQRGAPAPPVAAGLIGGRRASCADALRWALLLLLALAPGLAEARVSYHPDRNLIIVSDYPAEYPCTPELLHSVAKAHGWDIVEHDPGNDVYTVKAHLRIGLNDGTETYFQVASPESPDQKMVVHGNVIVSPFYVPGEHPYGPRQAIRRVNRLTIGVEGRKNLQAALKIHGGPETAHTLFVGTLPEGEGGRLMNCHGGELHVHGGQITALVQEWEHAVGNPGGHAMWFPSATVGRGVAGEAVLRDARLSWIAGFMGYGRHISSVNTVYEHGGYGVVNVNSRFAEYRGCVFRNLKAAVHDWGSLNAVLVDCVFEGNESNWNLTHGVGLEAIDCEIHPPRRGNRYRSSKHPRTSETRYPRFLSRRHIVVKVSDAGGRPIRNALVEAQEQKGRATPLSSRTGREGYTPRKGEPPRRGASPLLLREIKKQATDVPDEPEVTQYAYSLRVSAPGYAEAVLEDFRPTESWQVVEFTMAKED